MTPEFLSEPIDSQSARLLAGGGLDLRLVDTADQSNEAEYAKWVRAVFRGFHGTEPTAFQLAASMSGMAHRRTTGVWDPTILDPATPVATVNSWPLALTVPGGTVSSWAISDVSVAPTHRRRGIARGILEAELRTAHTLGVPIAILTVSESTIYGRFGFAPAALSADWTIDTRRARWAGPTPPGRIQFIDLATLRDTGLAIVDRARLGTPGQLDFSGYLWERLVGYGTTEAADRAKLRAVRYEDVDGQAQGFAVYSLVEHRRDFSRHTATVKYLAAATDDAAAALWRYLLELDLVSTVVAPLRSADEALPWLVTDARAVTKTYETGHLWARILDMAALEARRYTRQDNIGLVVTDPLGFIDGTWLLEVAADGTGRVTAVESVPEDAAAIAMGVNELSALYLGGTTAQLLARTGRVTELTKGSIARLDAAFRSAVAPWLSIWF